MNIGNIVTVGIDNQLFKRKLKEQGYTIISVDDISSVLNISASFDLMLMRGELLADVSNSVLERIYFINNSTPVVLLIKDSKSITNNLLIVLKNGTLDTFYEFEIKSGIIYQRIDRLIIYAKLNNNLYLMQQELSRQETLKKELSLREQILNHERGVNANIIASITSGLIIFDINGTIILANEQAKQFLKNADTEIIGSLYNSCLPQEICDVIETIIKEMKNPDLRPYLKKCKLDNSFFDIYCYRMLDYQKHPSGILMFVNDITEQENMNVLLYRTEKLATVGTMLSGIAHELRNPLAIISGRIQRALIKKNYKKEWIKKNFKSINTQTERCASIVNSLLNFTRNTATSSGYHKITEILDETFTYIEYKNIFDNIAVDKCYNNELMVYGDRSRFVQIFLNLITNAIDAMECRGILKISTQQTDSSYTLVEINDTGPGIEETAEKKIFDPFFSTKDPGKGTGLGLTIVHKIVQESNGKIWFNSKSGSTSFFVELPSERERLYDGTYTTR